MPTLHDLRVPADDPDAGVFRRPRRGLHLRAELTGSGSSSSTSDRLSASGRAPATARLTVLFTASSPIEPPGKRIGLTTKLSVAMRRSVPGTSPASASSSSPNAGASRPSISDWLALPPAPCATS